MNKLLVVNTRSLNNGKAICTTMRLLVKLVDLDPTDELVIAANALGMVIVADALGIHHLVNPNLLEETNEELLASLGVD